MIMRVLRHPLIPCERRAPRTESSLAELAKIAESELSFLRSWRPLPDILMVGLLAWTCAGCTDASTAAVVSSFPRRGR